MSATKNINAEKIQGNLNIDTIVSGTVSATIISATAFYGDGSNLSGVVKSTDSDTSSFSFVLDEDNMVSDSDTKVPTQQSVKAYVDGLDANNIKKNSDTHNKTFTLEAPTATDDITIFRTDVAITVQEVIAVSTGTSPSTTYQLKHSTDRSAAGNNLTTSSTTTSTSTGDVATLSDATIPANSFIWFETTAATGTNVRLTIDIRYTID